MSWNHDIRPGRDPIDKVWLCGHKKKTQGFSLESQWSEVENCLVDAAVDRGENDEGQP